MILSGDRGSTRTDFWIGRHGYRKSRRTVNIVNMTLRKKITVLKRVIEMRRMTLNDTKFDP